jgi:hypothetical protein
MMVVAGGLICDIPGVAQNVGGRLSGRATDPSGAVVPGVQVVTRNTSTNVSATTETNESGYYAIQLPIGVYEVTASHPGLESVAQQNVTITVGGDVGLDFVLKPATARTVVEVQAQATPLITPNEAGVTITVQPDLLNDFPIEISGATRNSAEFLAMVPGYTGSTFSANLNGGNGFDQEILIDDTWEAPCGFCTGNQSQMIVPSFAVQEFQVISNNVDAQYGRTSTGAIKFAFKSGSNAFHGDAFEYNRNEAYDARNFFAPTVGLDRQNEFGGEIGGPIRRNKTFFYGYYDGFRYSTTSTGVISSVLTPAMKAGDFSAAGIPPIYDPATTAPNGSGGFSRQQFSYNGQLNVIPPNSPELSSVSRYYASLLPPPNLPGIVNNYLGWSSYLNNSDTYLVKIDHSFSNTSQLSASYSWWTNPIGSPLNTSFGPNVSEWYETQHGDRAIVNWNKSLSGDKLNHFLAAFNLFYFVQYHAGQKSVNVGNGGNALAGLTGVAQGASAAISVGPYFLNSGGGLNKIAHSDGEIADDFSWLRGSHQMQFGVQVTNFYTIGLQFTFDPYGVFSFSPTETGLPTDFANTGYVAASYLLGQVDSVTFGQEPSQAWIQTYRALYAQDKWKIRHNLTLSYGLRWDYDAPIATRDNNIANLDPTLANPGAGFLPGALVFAGFGPGQAGKRQFANYWHKGFGPRLGLTYALSPKTVFRGAYGVMYSGNSGPAIFLNQQGYFTNATLSTLNGGVTPAFDWQSGVPAVPLGPYFTPTFANGGSTSYMQPNGARLPMIQNWNIGLEKQLKTGVVIDASWVGTASHHLLNGALDYNQLNPVYLTLGSELYDSLSASQPVPGITLPWAGFSGTVAQALRPLPQYQGITLSSDPIGNGTYNALQVRAQQKLSHGLAYLITYAVSKDLTDAPGFGGGAFLGATQNYYNMRAEKSIAPWNQVQTFGAAYSYDLPVGKGKWLNFKTPIMNKVLGEWKTTGFFSAASGSPIGVYTELSLPAIGGLRANLNKGVPILLNHNNGTFNPWIDTYLNINAFSAPAPFTFGNTGPELPSTRTFGGYGMNAALLKTIPLTERVGLVLKGEFFGVLNHNIFGGPITDINNPAFGQIWSASGNRTGQMSMTLKF